MKSIFETAREDVKEFLAWWDEGGCGVAHSRYRTESILRKSDFGRLQPERAHELAFRDSGIPERFRRFLGPLRDESELGEYDV